MLINFRKIAAIIPVNEPQKAVLIPSIKCGKLSVIFAILNWVRPIEIPKNVKQIPIVINKVGKFGFDFFLLKLEYKQTQNIILIKTIAIKCKIANLYFFPWRFNLKSIHDVCVWW